MFAPSHESQSPVAESLSVPPVLFDGFTTLLIAALNPLAADDAVALGALLPLPRKPRAPTLRRLRPLLPGQRLS